MRGEEGRGRKGGGGREGEEGRGRKGGGGREGRRGGEGRDEMATDIEEAFFFRRWDLREEREREREEEEGWGEARAWRSGLEA